MHGFAGKGDAPTVASLMIVEIADAVIMLGWYAKHRKAPTRPADGRAHMAARTKLPASGNSEHPNGEARQLRTAAQRLSGHSSTPEADCVLRVQGTGPTPDRLSVALRLPPVPCLCTALLRTSIIETSIYNGRMPSMRTLYAVALRSAGTRCR